MREAQRNAPLRFAAVHSDGRNLYAYRWASDDQPPTLYCAQIEGGTVVASEPYGDGNMDWSPIPANTVLHVNQDQMIKITNIGIPAM